MPVTRVNPLIDALPSAFNKTMEKLSKQGKSLKNFTYTDKETADEIYSAINSTQFIGVSVSIPPRYTPGACHLCFFLYQ